MLWPGQARPGCRVRASQVVRRVATSPRQATDAPQREGLGTAQPRLRFAGIVAAWLPGPVDIWFVKAPYESEVSEGREGRFARHDRERWTRCCHGSTRSGRPFPGFRFYLDLDRRGRHKVVCCLFHGRTSPWDLGYHSSGSATDGRLLVVLCGMMVVSVAVAAAEGAKSRQKVVESWKLEPGGQGSTEWWGCLAPGLQCIHPFRQSRYSVESSDFFPRPPHVLFWGCPQQPNSRPGRGPAQYLPAGRSCLPPGVQLPAKPNS